MLEDMGYLHGGTEQAFPHVKVDGTATTHEITYTTRRAAGVHYQRMGVHCWPSHRASLLDVLYAVENANHA